MKHTSCEKPPEVQASRGTERISICEHVWINLWWYNSAWGLSYSPSKVVGTEGSLPGFGATFGREKNPVLLKVEGKELVSLSTETNHTGNRRLYTGNLDRSVLMSLGKFIRCLYCGTYLRWQEHTKEHGYVLNARGSEGSEDIKEND
jgi:hypothetical protein